MRRTYSFRLTKQHEFHLLNSGHPLVGIVMNTLVRALQTRSDYELLTEFPNADEIDFMREQLTCWVQPNAIIPFCSGCTESIGIAVHHICHKGFIE
ncbi:hypothetical protein CDAR_568641 [Caerostris darwini]|uniref:Uncharacterized protein n=1 Tax=Caerostris darwini TaxID=1538125 RepID=A0AAV4W387_9ARAC|nr:hypothetical protein CDAR_568641 [Caerostris darwini]